MNLFLIGVLLLFASHLNIAEAAEGTLSFWDEDVQIEIVWRTVFHYFHDNVTEACRNENGSLPKGKYLKYFYKSLPHPTTEVRIYRFYLYNVLEATLDRPHIKERLCLGVQFSKDNIFEGLRLTEDEASRSCVMSANLLVCSRVAQVRTTAPIPTTTAMVKDEARWIWRSEDIGGDASLSMKPDFFYTVVGMLTTLCILLLFSQLFMFLYYNNWVGCFPTASPNATADSIGKKSSPREYPLPLSKQAISSPYVSPAAGSGTNLLSKSVEALSQQTGENNTYNPHGTTNAINSSYLGYSESTIDPYNSSPLQDHQHQQSHFPSSGANDRDRLPRMIGGEGGGYQTNTHQRGGGVLMSPDYQPNPSGYISAGQLMATSGMRSGNFNSMGGPGNPRRTSEFL